MALHFSVTGSHYSPGRITFGEDLVIPSFGELALLRSPHWECSAPLHFIGTQQHLLLRTEMPKKRVCGTEWSCFCLPSPFLWAFSKAKVGFFCWSLAAALTFPTATSWGDLWLVLAGTVLFRAWKHSDLSCVQVCVRLGIRAALMSALIHLKAAQDDFMQ